MTAVSPPLKDEDTALQDIRPQVAVRESRLPIWLAGIGLALLAFLLFNALEARRQRALAPTFTQSNVGRANIPVPLPELYVPDGLPPDYELRPQPQRLLPRYQVTRSPRVANPSPTPSFVPQYSPPPSSYQPDVTLPYAEGQPESSISAKGPMIGRLVNPSTTIPQGALIGAVLETALDSTRPGQARALVTRDVRGFDGTRILIPRGSRLIGEYKADLAPGQNRAQVQWTRIIRPDGVTIALDSPAADPLGRAGIGGKVNSHFFERLGGALLSSSIDFGLGAAARSIGGSPVIIALPAGGGAATAPLTEGMQIRPTLKVQQGARVNVFVSRDLDFSSVDNQ